MTLVVEVDVKLWVPATAVVALAQVIMLNKAYNRRTVSSYLYSGDLYVIDIHAQCSKKTDNKPATSLQSVYTTIGR